ncbi:MAG: hypothetical protein AXW14_06985 [Alteromonas sp. Nap_26]|nr:MAG: hypothetical protein AXW14_06985 [Alteromonas sp. Nap_26]
MDPTYTNLSSNRSLINYIGNGDTARSDLQDIANKARENQALTATYRDFESQLHGDNIEAFLDKIESGEAPISSESIANYLGFNRQKLAVEFRDIAAKFSITSDTTVNIENGELTVEGDGNEKLQHYLEKNTRLSNLINQTSKLSALNEWALATEYASQLKQDETSDDDIQAFLKSARNVVNTDNFVSFNAQSFGFASDGRTSSIIEQRERD